MTIDERRERARQWLEAVYRDVQDLIIDEHVFWELQKIVKANPRLSEARSHFKHWIMAAHVESAVIGIRRQVKQGDDSMSLMRLLSEVQRFPEIVSRAYYVGLGAARNSDLPDKFYQKDFDRLVGEDRAHVDPAAVQTEMDGLRAVAKRIEHYADRRFAHYDSRGVTQRPTFNEIGASLAECEKLIKRYKILLDGGSISNLLPPFQYDWKEIFTYPWIESES